MNDQPPAATKLSTADWIDKPLLSLTQLDDLIDQIEKETGRTVGDRNHFAEQLNELAHDFFFTVKERRATSLARQRKAYRRLVKALDSFHEALWEALETEKETGSEEPSTLIPRESRREFMAFDSFMTEFRVHLDQVGEELHKGRLHARLPYGNTGDAAIIDGFCDLYEKTFERPAGASKDRSDGGPFVRCVRQLLRLIEPSKGRRGLASVVSKELTKYRRNNPLARERWIALSDKH